MHTARNMKVQKSEVARIGEIDIEISELDKLVGKELAFSCVCHPKCEILRVRFARVIPHLRSFLAQYELRRFYEIFF
jgi:hypothetical protein